jgi:hypothetical protein
LIKAASEARDASSEVRESRIPESSRPAPLAAMLRDVSREVTGKEIVYTDAQLAEILSPHHFVEIRTTPGGPSPARTAPAIDAARRQLTSDQEWLQSADGRVAAAAARLRARAAAL